MGRTITAVYENGVLRPLEPLPLPEHAQVEIDVREIITDDSDQRQRERVDAALADAGLLVSPSVAATAAAPLSDDARAQLAQKLADAGVPPLSSAIIDEREGR